MKLAQAVTNSGLTDLEKAMGLRSEFAGGTLGTVIQVALSYIFPAAGLLLLLYLIYGGYKYMLSRGDPKSLEQAKGTITTAVIGFIIVFISYWVVQIVGLALGLTDITNTFK